MPTTTYIHKYNPGDIIFFRHNEKPQLAIIQTIVFYKDNTFGQLYYYKLARPDMNIKDPYEENELFPSEEELKAAYLTP